MMRAEGEEKKTEERLEGNLMQQHAFKGHVSSFR